MKRFIQILVFLFCACFCNAQQHVIDSLNQLISKATSDTQRINLMNQKTVAFWSVSLDSNLELSNKAAQESQAINYQPGELRALVHSAAVYIAKGDSALAKKNLDAATEILKTTKDTISLSDYYQDYGDLYGLEGKWDTSLVFYKNELLAIPSGFDTSWLPRIYVNISNAYGQSAKFSDALTYIQKALSIDAKVNNENNKAYEYGDIANVLTTMRDFVKAEQYCFSAIKLAKKMDDKSAEGYACTLLSQAYIGMHKYNEAYTYAMNAAGLEKAVAYDYGWEAADLSYAAEALTRLGKINEAKKLDSNAIIIADSLKLAWAISVAYAVMGDILKVEGKDKEAIPFYEKSCKSVTGSSIYDPEVADSYTSLSECYKKTGNFEKALQANKTAAEINNKLKKETILAEQNMQ